MNTKWLAINHDFLRIELAQLKDEGRDTADLESEFQAWLVRSPEELEAAQPALNALLDRAAARPFRPEAEGREPSDLASIRSLRSAPVSLPPASGDAKGRADRLLGAWLGRCCGCLLGKPVEGW
ncbi:MAG TPA: ADP-ribosylglycohydrolase family protein, partial [bacterium]|nr:ADP-ribosylglycohydrolase family protein [bacterium]